MSAPTLEIQPLDTQTHDRDSFTCGVAELDKYLKQDANRYATQRISVTYVLTEVDLPAPRPIIGYYSLSACVVQLDQAQKALTASMAKKLPRFPEVPATLMGRLATASLYRGKGYGAMLLVNALKRGKQHASVIGSYAMVVDAKDAAAEAFYVHYGFLKLAGQRLFLPFASVP